MKKLLQSSGIRSKIWIVDKSGNVIFGWGRYKMLESIRRTGSIQAAAKELKMSYRGVWARIKATEERLGEQLLVRNIGGSAGGGSQLTPFALNLMEKFQELHLHVVKDSDSFFSQNFIRAIQPGKSKSVPSRKKDICD